MRTIKLSQIVFDYHLYPRAELDTQHVTYMRQALQAGVTLPPFIIDKKSRRCIDGFHRGSAYKREFGEGHQVEVIEKSYRTEAEMFADAMRYNANHGRTLTRFDRTHCILRAEEFGLTNEQIASALSLTVEAVGQLRANRVGTLRSSGHPIPLKRTIQHKAGQTLTKAQEEANGRLSGMNQVFYVNQLIDLLENDLLDQGDKNLLKRLERLSELLAGVLVTA